MSHDAHGSTKSGHPSSVVKECQTFLQALRLDIKYLQDDPNLREKFEAVLSANARRGRALTFQCHSFLPLATAPALAVDWGVDLESSPRDRETSSHVQRPPRKTVRFREEAPSSSAPPPCSSSSTFRDPLGEWRAAATAPRLPLSRTTSPTSSSSRLNASADIDKERAIRDYLRRAFILSRGYDEVRDLYGSQTSFFSDALFNGSGMGQLLDTILMSQQANRLARSRSEALDVDGVQQLVPHRLPQSISDVKRNYAAVLHHLKGKTFEAVGNELAQLVKDLTPESVYLEHNNTVALDIYMILIRAYLPPPQNIPMYGLSHQLPADVELRDLKSTSTYAAYEKFLCQFLVSQRSLPDPDVYALPSDDCLVPGPEGAKFLSPRSSKEKFGGAPRSELLSFTPRRRPPAALFLPSVFPYLTNGVTLVQLAMTLGLEQKNKTEPVAHQLLRDFTLNPRAESRCKCNIALAVKLLRGLPVNCPDHEVAVLVNHIYGGNRLFLLEFLWNTVGKYSRTSPYTTGPFSSLSSARTTSEDESQRTTVSENVPTLTETKGLHDSVPTKVFHVAVPEARPSVTLGSKPIDEMADTRAAEPENLYGVEERELRQLQDWVQRTLGPHFRYSAEDGSFVVEAERWALCLSEPNLVFSDGVVLAHLIRVLERRRCDGLDSVKPSSKRAAKRFNIKRCLRFLEEERGLSFALPLMEERLLVGEATGVLSFLKTLRQGYSTCISDNPHR